MTSSIIKCHFCTLCGYDCKYNSSLEEHYKALNVNDVAGLQVYSHMLQLMNAFLIYYGYIYLITSLSFRLLYYFFVFLDAES